jgi:hypothetical protein
MTHESTPLLRVTACMQNSVQCMSSTSMAFLTASHPSSFRPDASHACLRDPAAYVDGSYSHLDQIAPRPLRAWHMWNPDTSDQSATNGMQTLRRTSLAIYALLRRKSRRPNPLIQATAGHGRLQIVSATRESTMVESRVRNRTAVTHLVYVARSTCCVSCTCTCGHVRYRARCPPSLRHPYCPFEAAQMLEG